MHRPVCYRCRKALRMCYCAEIKRFDNRPAFVILIHPKESRKAINTGRMAYLMLQNAWLFEGCDFSQHKALNEILQDPLYSCVLLFPGPAAVDLSLWSSEENKGKQEIFIILDGTWAMAKRMLRSSPNLSALPQVMFRPPRLSRFSIREQPHPHCYATIETVHHIIEERGAPSDGAHHHLMEVFETMVRKQEEFEAEESAKRKDRGGTSD